MDVAEVSEADFVRKNFKIMRELGSGAFGEVYKGFARDTREIVALKIMRKKHVKYCQNEVKAEELLRQIDHHENFVRLNRHFITDRNLILEFELLEMNLDEYMFGARKPLSLSKIQQITQQLLMALNHLKSIGLVHGDIKPDNIMVADHKHSTLRVKLIDFGLAFQVGNMPPGHARQALDYRAPEVILGLPLNEALDMWSLGCVVAFMYLGSDLYSARDEFDRVRVMVQMQGLPDNKLLTSAIYTPKFFSYNEQTCSWQIREDCGWSPPVNDATGSMTCLDDIVMARPNTANNEDTKAFVGLFKEMLEVDPGRRITSLDALVHPFLKVKHFPSDSGAGEWYRSQLINGTNTTFDYSVAGNEESSSSTGKEFRVKKAEQRDVSKPNARASNTALGATNPAPEKPAVGESKDSRLKKAQKKPEQKDVPRLHVNGAKADDPLPAHEQVPVPCMKEEPGLRVAEPRRPERRLRPLIHVNGASSSKVDALIRLHERRAACAAEDSKVRKNQKRAEHKAKSNVRVNAASSNKGDPSLPVPESTATRAKDTPRTRRAHRKPELKDQSTTVQENTDTGTRDKSRPKKTPRKLEPSGKSTRVHKDTGTGTKDESRSKKTPKKPDRKEKSKAFQGEEAAYIKDESVSKKTQKEAKQREKSTTLHIDDASGTKDESRSKKTPTKSHQKEKSRAAQAEPAGGIKEESRSKKIQKEPKTKSTTVHKEPAGRTRDDPGGSKKTNKEPKTEEKTVAKRSSILKKTQEKLNQNCDVQKETQIQINEQRSNQTSNKPSNVKERCGIGSVSNQKLKKVKFQEKTHFKGVCKYFSRLFKFCGSSQIKCI